MKKAVSLFAVSLFAAVIVNAQAAGQVDKKEIEQKVRAQVSAVNPSTDKEKVEKVIRAFELFKTNVVSHKYYEWNIIFQQMDDTREAYMELHGGDPAVVKAVAEYLSKPISIDNGAHSIKLPLYVKMECVTLWETEQVKFNEFGAALEADLKLVVPSKRVAEESLERVDLGSHFSERDLSNVDAALPVIKTTDDVARQIRANMYFPTGLNDKKAISDILQSFGNLVDEYNDLHNSNIGAARLAATYISQKVFTTKDGKTFNVIGFISQFEAVFAPGGYDDFKDNVRNDAAASTVKVLK